MELGVVLLAVLAIVASIWALRTQQTLEALRRENAHFQRILDNIPVGVTLVDSQSRVVAYNPAACALLDLPAELFADGPPTLEALVRFNAARGEYGPGDIDTLVEIILSRARLPRGRRITIEYTLVRGQNDSPADAHALAERLAGLRVKINLIPMNPIAHSELGPPEPAEVEAFQQILRDRGYLCFVRRRRGDDVSAACGQLVMLGKEPNRRFRERQPKPEGGQP